MQKLFICVSVIAVLLNSCSNGTGNKSVKLSVVNKLMTEDYVNIMCERGLDSIWAVEEYRAALRDIITDSTIDDEPKFIAAEILFFKDSTFPNETESHILSQIYPEMLKKGKYQFYFIMEDRNHNSHERNNFLSLGKKTIPYLYNMLDNNNSYFTPFHSNCERPLRIKDIACSFICQQLNILYTHYTDSIQNFRFIDSVKIKIPDSLKIMPAAIVREVSDPGVIYIHSSRLIRKMIMT